MWERWDQNYVWLCEMVGMCGGSNCVYMWVAEQDCVCICIYVHEYVSDHLNACHYMGSWDYGRIWILQASFPLQIALIRVCLPSSTFIKILKIPNICSGIEYQINMTFKTKCLKTWVSVLGFVHKLSQTFSFLCSLGDTGGANI